MKRRADDRAAPKVPSRAPADPEYTPTARERGQIEAYLERSRSRAPAPRVKIEHRPPKPAQIKPDHPSAAAWLASMAAAFGTTETAFATQLLNQLLYAMHRDREKPFNEADVNGALAAVSGIAPRDETEAMLAAQMVATHDVAMDFLRRARQAEYVPQFQSAGNLAVKLLRTYTAQLEALQRYRGKGEQKVTVEHVHVHKGGQAIVGNVEAGTRGPGASAETKDQSHAKQLTHAPEPTLRCPNPERDAVPVARRPR